MKQLALNLWQKLQSDRAVPFYVANMKAFATDSPAREKEPPPTEPLSDTLGGSFESYTSKIHERATKMTPLLEEILAHNLELAGPKHLPEFEWPDSGKN